MGQPVELELLEHCQGKLEVAEIQIENLKIALTSARVIGAAIGILMATEKVTADAAFNLLVQASQESQRKVRDIADTVVETGSLKS